MDIVRISYRVVTAAFIVILINLGNIGGVQAGIIIDVRDSYGAVADGVTDDRVAIQNAINAAAAGDTVRLRNDSSNNWAGFGIGGTLYVKSGVILAGYGGGSHLKALDNLSDGVMLSLNSNVTLSSLWVNGMENARIGIWASPNLSNINITNGLIANLKAQTSTSGSARGISIGDGCSDVTIETTLIQCILGGDNNIVGDVYGANRGIYIGEVTNVLVDDCDIKWIYSYEDGDGIQVQTVPDASGTYAESDVTINNCRFYNCVKSGVKLVASGVSVTNCTITGTYTYDPGHYAGIRSEAGDYNYIAGNTISLARTVMGIQVARSTGTEVVDNDVSITGNYTQARASDIRAMRLLDCSDIIVSGNSFYSSYRGIHLYDYEDDCIDIYIYDNIIDVVLANSHVYDDLDGNYIYDNTLLTH